MTDQAILAEIGARFRDLRLRKNLTQRELAERTALSVTAIKSLEAGRTRLQTAVAVLRELGQLDELDRFIPPPGISPMQLAKLGGRKRERATGSRGKRETRDDGE
ncbi:MAG: helix-turn-helix transcriptional regulator [Gammaproteobacteria bacterium]|nr:helix-turn-helix transcriptional regulator [Gammaproteobacteria bacterium]